MIGLLFNRYDARLLSNGIIWQMRAKDALVIRPFGVSWLFLSRSYYGLLNQWCGIVHDNSARTLSVNRLVLLRMAQWSIQSMARPGHVSKQRGNRFSTATADWCGGARNSWPLRASEFWKWRLDETFNMQRLVSSIQRKLPSKHPNKAYRLMNKSHPSHRQRCTHDAMQTFPMWRGAARRGASARRAAPRWQWLAGWLSAATRQPGWWLETWARGDERISAQRCDASAFSTMRS